MLKKFTSKELIFIALSGALMFSVAFSMGVFLIAATGTPMVGGIIINLFVAFIFVSALLVIRKFGTGTLIALIHTTLSIPTVNFGPPGVYKPVLGLILGVVAESILYVGKYKKWAYYLAVGFAFVVLVPVMYYTLVLLGIPEAEKMAPLLIPLAAIYLVEALIGTWLAILVYEKKLKNSRLVRLLRG